jgi:hypothetical protein
VSQINRLTATLDEVAGKVTSLITHSEKTSPRRENRSIAAAT